VHHPVSRVVVVSLGSIGRRHLANLRSLYPAMRIAVWRRPGSAEEAPPGADRLCSSLEDVLRFRPDAAIIASPTVTHLDIAIRLASEGIHLFIEKPIAHQITGIDELLAVCNQNKLVLMVGYNLRFLPSLRRARHLILDGAIGGVISARAEVGQYLPTWRPDSDYREGVTARSDLGGGVLLELSHEIDYVLWIFGAPTRVIATGGRYGDLEIDVEDVMELLLLYDSPARLVSVHLDMLQRAPIRQCRFIGSDGVLVWDGLKDEVNWHKKGAWQMAEDVSMADKNQLYRDELRHFFACIEAHAPPACSGEDGLAVMAVVDAARKSMASGRVIELSKGRT